MNQSSVRKILLEDQHIPKLIQLDDGRSFRIRGVEYWAVGDRHLVVMDQKVGQIHFPYRKIASIQEAPPKPNKRRGKPKP